MYIFFSNNVFEPIKGIEFGKITTKELERFFPRGVNKFRNYREFILKGNEKEDFNSLEMARPFINNLWISKDTMNGIHIMLNEDTKFWAFIKILDIMKDEKVEYYIWEINNFRIFYKEPLRTEVYYGFGNCIIGEPYIPIEKVNRNNLFQEQIQSSFFLLKLFWLPLMLFACLIWINYQQLKYV